ncbi:hypothetical protein BSL78_03499 [Apostichopus japonicus]|uniref:Uncharacterized protein n=1 Tax=Stichopus japonicus TaxID=307972 RepID=A0A2G8LH64_STIJA|nr:hypothetical protein BSL78_03499 [Apostichopus japonicus]
MESALKVVILYIFLSAFLVDDGEALRVVGHTEEDFETDLSYIARFVFAPKAVGRLRYSIKIPAEDCCSDLVGFNGKDGQWPLINAHGHEMTCLEKLGTITGIKTTIYPLMQNNGFHICDPEVEENGRNITHCYGDRKFYQDEAEWNYFVFMNCHARSHTGINATYDLHLTNERNHEALAEFSADEDTNLVVTFTCGTIILGCLLISFVFGVILWSRKMLHATYKIWIFSLCLHFTGCVIMTKAWYSFSLDGYERKKQVTIGHAFTSAGSIVFAILMIVISKGYTITRLTIRRVGKVKIFAFASWFSFCYMILYIILGQSDPRDIKNIYDTPAALGIVCMRIGATIWCLYGAVFTLKDFPKKGAFYLIFTILSSSWFLAEPVMILFSNFWLPLYCRAKWIHAMYLITLVFGHVVFVILTRPSATNTYFPYHLSTNKVGIAEDEETASYDYVPTEATFTNFLAFMKYLRKEEHHHPADSKRATASNSSQKQPSKGRFDMFMAGSERAKVEQKTNVHSPLPSISASISMTTLVNCPVPPSSNLPVTYMMDYDSQTPVLSLVNQQIQSTESDSVSVKTLDKEDDWTNLVMENLDAPKDNCNEVKYNVTVPTVKTPALTGQNGMYALADSDESDSSPDDARYHEIQPIHKLQSSFKNIKLEQPKEADKPRKSHRLSDKKEQPQPTPKPAKESTMYDMVPTPAKGTVIYVKPAVDYTIQLREPRKECLERKHKVTQSVFKNLPETELSSAGALYDQINPSKYEVQSDDVYQQDIKTINDAEPVRTDDMERGRLRERQERRTRKGRHESTRDRHRHSATLKEAMDGQDQVHAVEETNTQRKSKQHHEASYYEVVDEVNHKPPLSQKQGKLCGPTASEDQPETAAYAQPSVRRKKTRKISSSELSIEDVIEQEPVSQRRSKHHRTSLVQTEQQQQNKSQKQGKLCGPTASESQTETAACADQPSVRRKKTRKIPSSELTIEDVIEQEPVSQKRSKHHSGASSRYLLENEKDQQPMDEGKKMERRRRRILKMRAALEMEEMEYRKNLSKSNSDSSVKSTVEEENKKSMKRNAIHKARRTLETNNTSEQE